MQYGDCVQLPPPPLLKSATFVAGFFFVKLRTQTSFEQIPTSTHALPHSKMIVFFKF